MDKTTIVKRNLSPQWLKQPISFDQNEDKTIPIIFEVLHADSAEGIFMGEARLTLQQAMEAPNKDEICINLTKKTDVEIIGEMRIAFHTRKAFILPDKDYDSLFQLLIDASNTMSLTKKLAAVSTKKEKPVAECLVKTFEMRRSAGHFIKMITSAEIENTTDPNVIFRSNTVATKAVDMYMRLTGMPYLISIMRPIVQQIIYRNEQKKISCELDEFRIEGQPSKKQKIIKKNLVVLHNYVAQIFDDIILQLPRLPTNFRYIFEHIAHAVGKKWPDHETVKYTSIAGFIFLRFFGPSLLAPKSYNLTESHPSPNAARDLTLIAKTLQNLANLVLFGKKEPFMQPANQFIQQNLDKMKHYLTLICQPQYEAVDEIPAKRDTINWGREMAQVQFHLEDNLEAMEEMFGKSDTDLIKLREELSKIRLQKEHLERRKTPIENRPLDKESSSDAPSIDTPGSKSLTGSLTNGTTTEDISNFKDSGGGETLEEFLTSSFGLSQAIGSIPTSAVKTQERKPALSERWERNAQSSTHQTPSGTLRRNAMDSVSEIPTNPECTYCKKTFLHNDKFLVAQKLRWHIDCFNCINCKKPITGNFLNKETGPQCYTCTNQPKTCTKCNGELNTVHWKISVEHSKHIYDFHKDCWKCYRCGLALGDNKTSVSMGFRLAAGEEDKETIMVLCESCVAKKEKCNK
jgi:hypothetical protein